MSKLSIELSKKPEAKVHLLPCSLDFEGTAKVSHYFESTIDKKPKKDTLTASFRGKPLEGHVVSIPKSHIGLVLKKGEEGKLITRSTFSEVTSWKWDQNPKSCDNFASSLDWIDIASAIHN